MAGGLSDSSGGVKKRKKHPASAAKTPRKPSPKRQRSNATRSSNRSTSTSSSQAQFTGPRIVHPSSSGVALNVSFRPREPTVSLEPASSGRADGISPQPIPFDNHSNEPATASNSSSELPWVHDASSLHPEHHIGDTSDLPLGALTIPEGASLSGDDLNLTSLCGVDIDVLSSSNNEFEFPTVPEPHVNRAGTTEYWLPRIEDDFGSREAPIDVDALFVSAGPLSSLGVQY